MHSVNIVESNEDRVSWSGTFYEIRFNKWVNKTVEERYKLQSKFWLCH